MTSDGFAAHLEAHPTACAALEAWCRGRLAGDALLVRVLSEGPAGPADVPLAGDLQYRRVALFWGEICVSMAENWYRPASLPPEMVAGLSGNVPFGILIAPLRPRRRVTHMAAGSGNVLLHVEAVLSLPQQGDIAFVREDYRRDLLGVV